MNKDLIDRLDERLKIEMQHSAWDGVLQLDDALKNIAALLDESRAAIEAQSVPATQDAATLLSRYERQWHRMGELWNQCQGNGWAEKESDEFTKLRDEKSPATRAKLIAMLAAAPQPVQPAQPEQEPVAFVKSLDALWPLCVIDLKYCSWGEHERGDHLKYIPLYTTPQAQPLSDEQSRAAFEAFVSSELGDVAVMDQGRYISPKIQNYWLTWQAAITKGTT